MELKDLVGRHLLDTAAVMSTIKSESKWKDDAEAVSFGMDGKTYTFVEDPEDGYRSYLGDIIVEDGHSERLKGASKIGREVNITHEDKSPENSYEKGRDLITIKDIETSHVWLVIGTRNTDDYYPYCVLDWQAMSNDI